MSKPYATPNNVESAIAAENSWTRGTDTSVVLTDASLFDAGGGYVSIGDDDSYAEMAYTGKSSNTLTGLAVCTLGKVVSVGDETKTWPAGTVVARVLMGEDLNDKVDKATYTEQSILAAVSAATPVAVAVAEQRIVGRLTGGNIKDLTVAEVKTLLAVGKHFLRGTIDNPKDHYDNVSHVLCIWASTDAAITITKIQITCEADPTTELDIDLKWADAFIGLANAAVIDVCDTINGVVLITAGFDDATVASGKCLYWSFGAAPDAAITQFSFVIEFTYD